MKNLTITTRIEVSYDGYMGFICLDTANHLELCMVKENIIGLHNCTFNGTPYVSKCQPTLKFSKVEEELICLEVELNGQFEVDYYAPYYDIYSVDGVKYRKEYFTVEQCAKILQDCCKFEGHVSSEKDFMDEE